MINKSAQKLVNDEIVMYTIILSKLQKSLGPIRIRIDKKINFKTNKWNASDSLLK